MPVCAGRARVACVGSRLCAAARGLRSGQRRGRGAGGRDATASATASESGEGPDQTASERRGDDATRTRTRVSGVSECAGAYAVVLRTRTARLVLRPARDPRPDPERCGTHRTAHSRNVRVRSATERRTGYRRPAASSRRRRWHAAARQRLLGGAPARETAERADMRAEAGARHAAAAAAAGARQPGRWWRFPPGNLSNLRRKGHRAAHRAVRSRAQCK